LRRDIIWHKPNGLPENVPDRPTTSHEYLFMLTKQENYYYDGDSTRGDPPDIKKKKNGRTWEERKKIGAPMRSGKAGAAATPGYSGFVVPSKGPALRSVWSVPTAGFSGAHFATFPEDLIIPCLKMSASLGGRCSSCGAPYLRKERPRDTINDIFVFPDDDNTETFWDKSCSCENSKPQPSLVFDPFFGAGTTALVAHSLGFDCCGTELNKEYINIAKDRLEDAGIQVEVVW